MKYFIHRESKAIVELADITFCSQGGGFVRKMRASDFYNEFEPYEFPDKPQPGFVCFDDGPEYPALISPYRWNGWAQPYFTFEVGMQVMAAVNSENDGDFQLRYDSALDAFVLHDGHSGDEPWVMGAEEIDGVKYYGIGAGSWCWNTVGSPEA